MATWVTITQDVAECRALDGELDVTCPTMIHAVRPDYPEEARRFGVSGVVLLKLVVDETGLVTRTEVVDHEVDCLLVDAALEVTPQWRFEPASRAGTVVPCSAVVEIVFWFMDVRSLRCPKPNAS